MAGKKPVSDSVVIFVTSLQRLVFTIIFILAWSTIVQAQPDTQPPRLTGLRMNVPAVDVTSSSQVVTFALAIQDDLSGIDSTSPKGVAITLSSPSINQVVSGVAAAQSGVILNGVFLVPVTLPRYGEAGNWRITSLRLRDNAGNAVALDNVNLTSAGFTTTVLVSDANPDTAPPQLLGVAFSLASIDVGASSQSMTVTLILSDDLSGVSQGFSGVDDFVMTSPSGKQSQRLSINQFQLISGTNTLGMYRATLTVAQYSEPGVWKVSTVRLHDNAGSQRLYGGAELAPFGSAIQITVSSNPSDTTPPQLTGLAFTPSLINTSSSSQDVQVDFTITDNLSGVSFAPDNPFASATFGATFVSPSGAQSVSTNSTFSSAVSMSGIPTNGTWRFTTTFPRFSEEGTWKVSVSLKDAVRNLVNYSSSDLASLGLSHELIVNRATGPQQIDGTISDPAAGGSVSDDTFGDRARVVVPGNVLSQPTAIIIDVLQSPPQAQLPAGFSGSESYFVNIQFIPVPTFPLRAPGLPGLTLVLPLRTFVTSGTAINLFRIDSSTGLLVAALNSSGSPIVGNVDPGGLSATFQGVIQLSTVVGLLPSTPVTGTVEVTIVADHPINTKSHAKIEVTILSSAILDATKIDPSTLRFAGASVETKGHGKFQISIRDENGDGLPDMIASFRANELHLDHDATQAVLEGRTFDNRAIHGVVTLRVVRKGSRGGDDEDEDDEHENDHEHD
jgi:hypothetical protein